MERPVNIKLKIIKPSGVLISVTADKVMLESPEGFFCIKPRHVDLATVIEPGVISYTAGSEEKYIGTSEGLAVKCGNELLISVRHAVEGRDLKELHLDFEKHFRVEDKEESEASNSMKKLEADLVRSFMKLSKED